MGNIFTQEEDHAIEEEIHLNSEERKALRKLFDSHFGEIRDKQHAYEKCKELFYVHAIPEFHILLYDYISDYNDNITYMKFQKFIVQCCRTTPYNAFDAFWKILSNKGETEDSTILQQFLKIIHEIGGGSSSSQDLDILHLTNHISKITKKLSKISLHEEKNNQNLINFQALSQWVNEYAPNIPKLIGPTCILINCRAPYSHVILGAYSEDRWRDSNRFYGSTGTFLFTLSPELNIYRNKNGSNEAYQWLNLKSYGLPHGLGLGGNTEKFRLFIPDSLENCQIWACGGEDMIASGMKALVKDRSNRDDLIRQARKVDKAAFADNAFDQEFLLSKTFAHKVKVADDAP
eukprot:gene3295-6528_t